MTFPRRGGAAVPILATLSVLGVFGVAAAVFGPAYLQADSASRTQEQSVAASNPRNQQTIDSLALLIGGSAEILAVHPRGHTPYAEIVLRLTADSDDDEYIKSSQIALISHSNVLRTITLYAIGDGPWATGYERQAHSPQPTADGPSGDVPAYFSRTHLKTPAFCTQWRASRSSPSDGRSVIARVVATEVLDMQLSAVKASKRPNVETSKGGGQSDHFDVLTFGRSDVSSPLRLSLIWAADSADGRDEASVTIHRPMHVRNAP